MYHFLIGIHTQQPSHQSTKQTHIYLHKFPQIESNKGVEPITVVVNV